MRRGDGTVNLTTPAPNRYTLYGDFDLKQPTAPPHENIGKKAPKGRMGIKTNIKNHNLDVPGPATYDIDQYPNSQKVITRCFGTDDRKGLGQPNARDYPGPGHYFIDHKEPPQGP